MLDGICFFPWNGRTGGDISGFWLEYHGKEVTDLVDEWVAWRRWVWCCTIYYTFITSSDVSIQIYHHVKYVLYIPIDGGYEWRLRLTRRFFGGKRLVAAAPEVMQVY